MTGTPRLSAFQDALAALRFCPMLAPAGEVSGLTGLESHATRARIIQLWRIASSHQEWTARDAEIIYQCTLDSISEAFDVYHAPIASIMLAARADIWDTGLAPQAVKSAVAKLRSLDSPPFAAARRVLVAGEVSTTGDDVLCRTAQDALSRAGIDATIWNVPSGATAFALGAHDLAREQASSLRERLKSAGVNEVITDGPDTFWAMTKMAAALNLPASNDIHILSLASVLANTKPTRPPQSPVFVHDARAAFFLADKPPVSAAIMPGYDCQPGATEAACGVGAVFDEPRRALGHGTKTVWGSWTRGLARSSGADDGLFLTYPKLASGLAEARLDYASGLCAATVVTDSAASAAWLRKNRKPHHPQVIWLAEAF